MGEIEHIVGNMGIKFVADTLEPCSAHGTDDQGLLPPSARINRGENEEVFDIIGYHHTPMLLGWRGGAGGSLACPGGACNGWCGAGSHAAGSRHDCQPYLPLTEANSL